MAEPTIVRGSDHHFSFTYTGTGLGQRVGTFVPFTDNGTISHSCLFNDGNGEYIHRTPGSDGNRRTWTWSAWVRRQKLAAAYSKLIPVLTQAIQELSARVEELESRQ